MGKAVTRLLDQKNRTALDRSEFSHGFAEDRACPKSEMMRVKGDHGVNIVRVENNSSDAGCIHPVTIRLDVSQIEKAMMLNKRLLKCNGQSNRLWLHLHSMVLSGKIHVLPKQTLRTILESFANKQRAVPKIYNPEGRSADL